MADHQAAAFASPQESGMKSRLLLSPGEWLIHQSNWVGCPAVIARPPSHARGLPSNSARSASRRRKTRNSEQPRGRLGLATAISRRLREDTPSQRHGVHLFQASPLPLAIMIGHLWMPRTQVYDDLGPGSGYTASYTI